MAILKRTFADIIGRQQPRGAGEMVNARIVCKDGTSLSVQANEYVYCAPRDNYGPYYEVEVGFPLDAEGNAKMKALSDKLHEEMTLGDSEEAAQLRHRQLAEYHQTMADTLMEMPSEWERYGDGYAGDEENPGRGSEVWAYVPVDLVRKFIDAHGGEVENG